MLCIAAVQSSIAQGGLTINAPNNLELNCLNANFTIISSWLTDYEVVNNCEGKVRVSNDFDGKLPDICGQPIFVKWIVTNECNQIDSAGSTITINTDFERFGFEICPNDISVFADTTNCGTMVTFPQPYARNCFGPIETTQQRNSNSVLRISGEEFPLGDTEIFYTAEDACGKRDTCRFDIIVIRSDDLVNLYCPDSEVMRVCSNIDGCGWDSTGDLVKPATTFIGCNAATISYRVQLPSGQTMTSAALQDDDGDASGFVFPLGESLLCYIINNAGGSATCCFNVIVEDCSPPTLICPGTANFSCDLALDQDRLDEWITQAILSDNCDLNPSIRTIILDTLGTCGADEMIEYLYIASDNIGNEKACVASVNLSDEVGPEITVARLPDRIVECKGSVRNQEILIAWLAEDGGFNESHVINNCPSDINWSFDPTTTTYQTNPNSCSPNVGFYDVVFFARDRCGNQSNTARAKLVFEDNTAPTVSFPDSLRLDCDINNLEASVENLLNDVIAIDSCSSLRISTSFDLNVIECEIGDNQLEINFTVTDACGNETISTGLVNLVKEDRSTIQAPTSLVIRCGQDIDSLIGDWLDDYSVIPKCDSIDVIHNFNPDMIDVCGSDQLVIWILRDTCGTTRTASSQLIILPDENPPIFLNCPVNVTLDVNNEDCTANYLFDFPQVEDCSNENILIKQDLTPGQPIFTSGSDFPIGTTAISFTATDNCDNVSTCSFTVRVREDAVCAQGALQISGNIKSAGGTDLENVQMTLSSAAPEFPLTRLTNENGDYVFDKLPPRFDYTLDLVVIDDVNNGLSTADLVQIRNHILGLSIFNSSLKVIAADANNDQSLSAVDIVLLQNIVIGFQDTLPSGNAWRFVNTDEINSSTLLPWPEIDEFDFLNLSSNVSADFIGIKVGDVNNTASDPSGIVSKTEIRNSAIELKIDNVSLSAGEETTFHVHQTSRLDIQGFQLALDLNKLELLSIESDQFEIGDQNLRQTQNTIIFNSFATKSHAIDLPSFSITVKARNDLSLKEAITLNRSAIKPEFYAGKDLEIFDVSLLFNEIRTEPHVFPNPFSFNSTISYYAQENGRAQLRVYTPSGQEILRKSKSVSKGHQVFELHSDELPQSGILFYAIQQGGQTHIGKLILLD